MSIQTVFNSGNPNQIGECNRLAQIGDLLAFLAKKAAATESGVTVTSNVATLAATPSLLIQVDGITSGAVHTIKKLRKGPISGASALVPAAGEVIWDGGVKLLFAAADAAATCNVTYAVATDTASFLSADFVDGIQQ